MSSYRSKPGISSRDYKTRPSLARQRQAFGEISTTSIASAVWRKSIASLLEGAKDSKTHLRFNAAMYKVLSTDSINPIGHRRVENGNLQLLNRFEFNAFAALHTRLFVTDRCTINRAEGQCTWTIDSFQPTENIKAPAGASHFKLVSAGVEADFAKSVATANIAETAYLPLNELPTGEIQLRSTVTPNSNLPLFLVAGVQFYEQMNGEFYPLKDKKFNPLMILEVDSSIKL
jgi:hypothetical protein